MWKVELRCDLVRRSFDEDFNMYPYMEVYYVVAIKGDKMYIHFTNFVDDWEGASKLVDRIKECDCFTPENKPGIWSVVVDKKPYNAAARFKKDWRYFTAWRR